MSEDVTFKQDEVENEDKRVVFNIGIGECVAFWLKERR